MCRLRWIFSVTFAFCRSGSARTSERCEQLRPCESPPYVHVDTWQSTVDLAQVFSKLDGAAKGYLTSREVVAGLRVVNDNLISDGEVEYVMQVLDLLNASHVAATDAAAGVAPTPGEGPGGVRVGVEIFAITAALSERVVGLDPVVRNCISSMVPCAGNTAACVRAHAASPLLMHVGGQ